MRLAFVPDLSGAQSTVFADRLDAGRQLGAALARFPVANRTVIVVDDGLAAGSTMIAAARSVRARQPQRLVVAVPVAPLATCDALREEA